GRVPERDDQRQRDLAERPGPAAAGQRPDRARTAGGSSGRHRAPAEPAAGPAAPARSAGPAAAPAGPAAPAAVPGRAGLPRPDGRERPGAAAVPWLTLSPRPTPTSPPDLRSRRGGPLPRRRSPDPIR